MRKRPKQFCFKCIFLHLYYLFFRLIQPAAGLVGRSLKDSHNRGFVDLNCGERKKKHVPHSLPLPFLKTLK